MFHNVNIIVLSVSVGVPKRDIFFFNRLQCLSKCLNAMLNDGLLSYKSGILLVTR